MQAASARTRQGIYLPFGWSCSPSLHPSLISPHGVTLSARRGAERHAITVVGIVVVAAAAGIDIMKITRRGRVGGPEPPVGCTSTTKSKFYRAQPIDHGRFLYRSLSLFITALTRRISVSIISTQYFRVSISIPKSS